MDEKDKDKPRWYQIAKLIASIVLVVLVGGVIIAITPIFIALARGIYDTYIMTGSVSDVLAAIFGAIGYLFYLITTGTAP